MRSFLISFLFITISFSGFGQETGLLAGIIGDQFNDNGLFAVKVKVGDSVTRTDQGGQFHFNLLPGNYSIQFSRYGLYPMEISGLEVTAGGVTFIDTAMRYFEVPPAYVEATSMDNDSWIQVTWATSGPDIFEPAYDDGEVDDMFTYSYPDNQVATKFTPYGYDQRHVIGGRMYVGDGSFPGPFLGRKFLAMVYDDEGMDGNPGNILFEDTVTVDQYGWIGFDSLDAWCSTDNYYLSMYQLETPPNSPPIGIDLDNPNNNDRQFMKFGDFGWQKLFEGNAMIRPWVAQQNDSMDFYNYRVARLVGFDPYNGGPEQGTLEELATTQNLFYNEYAVYGMNGCRAYCIKTLYKNGQYSPYKISNVVCIWNDAVVSIDVSLSGDSLSMPVKFTFKALDEFHTDKVYAMEVPDTGYYWIPEGKYQFTAWTAGYEEYIIDTINIANDTSFSVCLIESCTPVDQISVFPFNGQMEWEKPYAYLYEWKCDTPLTCHEQITPELDLTSAADWFLSIYYYDEPHIDPSNVEYSTDQGNSWEVLYQLTPQEDWQQADISLEPFCGPNGASDIIFRIRQYNSGSGDVLTLEHVWIWSPGVRSFPDRYFVLLDEDSVGTTYSRSFQLTGLNNGQTYRAGVIAKYSSGESDTAFEYFTYLMPFPPENIRRTEDEDYLQISWSPPSGSWSGKAPENSFPDALIGYKVFYQAPFISTFFSNNGQFDTIFSRHRLSCDTTLVSVTAVYDLSEYGYPGDTIQSVPVGPLIYPGKPPYQDGFYEEWNSQSFYDNCWLLDGHYMSILSDQGNPGPAFVFDAPEILGYQATLTGYPIYLSQNSSWQELLEFDLKLSTSGSSMYWEDKLVVSALPEIEADWVPITEITNYYGGFEWQHYYFDLKEFFTSDQFRLRFNFSTFGEKDALWTLDNIQVHNVCTGPDSITAIATDDSHVQLTWSNPFPGRPDTTFRYYKIYRKFNDSEFELLAQTTFINYLDTVSSSGRYCYMVSAYFTSGEAECESSLSDSACVFSSLGMNELEGNSLRIYPNPAEDYIMVVSDEEMDHIELYNSLGMKVKEINEVAKWIELNVKDYKPGIYFISVRIREATIRGKVIIN